MEWHAVKHPARGYVIAAEQQPFTMRLDGKAVESTPLRANDPELLLWQEQREAVEDRLEARPTLEKVMARIEALETKLKAMEGR